MASIAMSLLLNILYLSYLLLLPTIDIPCSVCLIEFPQEVFGWFGSEQRILSRENSPLALTHYVTYCDWGHTIPSIVAYI